MKTSEVSIFNYGQNTVRVTMRDTNPWFVAKDLCEVLDIQWGGTALAGISAKNKGMGKFPTPGGTQSLSMVSEAGMYRLVMRSTKPDAEKFQDWVTEEILPTIRRHNMYLMPAVAKQVIESPETFLARAVLVANEMIAAMKKKIAADAPAVAFTSAVTKTDDSITVNEMAKILNQNNFDIGANRLYEWCRAKGYLQKSGREYNKPTQLGINSNWFRVEKVLVSTSYCQQTPRTYTAVTAKGQVGILNKFNHEEFGMLKSVIPAA